MRVERVGRVTVSGLIGLVPSLLPRHTFNLAFLQLSHACGVVTEIAMHEGIAEED